MTGSAYGEGSTFATNAGTNNENLTYDKNGNILTLARNLKGTGLIDNLTYSYKNSGVSNMLDRVDDAVSGPNGFSEYVQQANEYAYDGNGNLNKDDNKGYNSIQYNYLNLPKQVGTTNDNIKYIYDAAGTKLAKIGTSGNYTYYAGSFVYSGSSLNYILTKEGMWLPGGNYQYYLKDHLGNTRLAVNTSGQGGTVVQQTDYYPFGMDITVYNGGLDNKYRYNGKEFQEDMINNKKLDWYDYGARFYDPVIGRWHSIDPVADQAPGWSPYRYGLNNPIKFIDPTGMLEDWVERANSKKIEWDEKVTSSNDKDLQAGDKYLGKNVLVATDNRDANLNETINTAKFDLYLESKKDGPSATIMGNTVPSDVKKYGTLAEGLYPARSQGRASYLEKGKEDLALIINEGKSVPTAPGSPKATLSEIFFHSGNYGKTSLWYTKLDGTIDAISKGCQTSGCGPNSRPFHNSFMKAVGIDFNGNYYLRGQESQ